MFSYKAKSLVLAALISTQSAWATTINFGDYTDGNMVKTVTGVWTYNEKVKFDAAGKYQLKFADLNFGEKFEYVGAMVSTPDKKVASVTLKNGVASSLLPMTFDVTEQEYWISVFAFTNSQSNVGTLGLNLDWAGQISQVPAPPAFVLFATALLGIGAWFRRKKHSNK